MSKSIAGCLLALGCAVSLCLLILGGALDVSLQLHIPPAFLRRNPDPVNTVLEIEMSRQENQFMALSDEAQTHRKLQGLQLSHSRQPKYSIYTGEREARPCMFAPLMSSDGGECPAFASI